MKNAQIASLFFMLTLTAACEAGEPGDAAPRTISVTPANGAKDISPGKAFIRINFDQVMDGRGFSITDVEDATPLPIATKPRFTNNNRSVILEVRLKPGQRYGYSVNNGRFRNFKSKAGVPSTPYKVIFSTRRK